MVDYYLIGVNEGKIQSISDLVGEFGLKAAKTKTYGIAAKYNPDKWYKDGIFLRVYEKECPIQIISEYHGAPVEDPNFDLIKRVVALLEPEKVVNSSSRLYDMDIFKW